MSESDRYLKMPYIALGEKLVTTDWGEITPSLMRFWTWFCCFTAKTGYIETNFFILYVPVRRLLRTGIHLL